MYLEMRDAETLVLRPHDVAELELLKKFEGAFVRMERPRPFELNAEGLLLEALPAGAKLVRLLQVPDGVKLPSELTQRCVEHDAEAIVVTSDGKDAKRPADPTAAPEGML